METAKKGRTIKVMTFNLRFANDDDGADGWDRRREQVIRLVERYDPAILGTQEGMQSQLSYLERQLTGYTMNAEKRTWDSRSQYPTLFISKKHFLITESGERWLSKTPKVHLSKDWDSAFPRMMNFAALIPKAGGSVIWAAVTHLDHVGATARYEQGRLLAQWAQSKRRPVILMGDFNDSPESPLHRLLAGADTGLCDTWEKTGGKAGPESFTHHGFKGIPQQSRMDWILASAHFEVLDSRIIRDNEGGYYPSDHFPYMALLKL